MQPVSSAIPGTAQFPTLIAGVKEPQKALPPGDAGRGRSPKPVMDEYVPEEPRESSGRYWPGRGADGRPGICFDDPERAAGAPQKQDELPDADAPDAGRGADGSGRKASGDKAETCTCDTDKVDREIESLKKRWEELDRQIRSETDDTKIGELEKELARIERELRQKDNDSYRRRHAVFS